MPNTLGDTEWHDLLTLIQERKCTPFLGAGACVPWLPTGAEIAQEWAETHDFPLADTSDLAKVAQYLAIERYEMYPKEDLKRRLEGSELPDFAEDETPHSVLASLELPIYMTTNYDRFMYRALNEYSESTMPHEDFYRWNNYPEVIEHESILADGSEYEPSRDSPLVYHLHGNCALPQSMVLTEGDYLDFLIQLSRKERSLPATIRTAMTGTSLLFIGYSLTDWSFRVIFRGLVRSMEAGLGYPSVAVLLPPADLEDDNLERAQSYLNEYFDQIQGLKISVYWGTAQDFAAELRDRWTEFNADDD